MRDYEIMHDELVKRLDRIISILETLSSHIERSKRRPEYVDTTTHGKWTIEKGMEADPNCLCNIDKSVCPKHPAR